MRKPIIAGNWKMNKTLSEAQSFAEAVKNAVPSNDVVDAVIGSPALFLAPLAWNLKDSEVKLAAQNCYWENAGAFTGENSPAAIADLGVNYVIIGHSERREYFHETDEDINKKAKAIFANGMTPIFCCGETLETYEAGKTAEWIEGQITNGLVGLSNEQVASMVIAYEPIWQSELVNLQMLILQMKSVVLFVQQLKNYTAKKFLKLFVFNTVVLLNQKTSLNIWQKKTLTVL